MVPHGEHPPLIKYPSKTLSLALLPRRAWFAPGLLAKSAPAGAKPELNGDILKEETRAGQLKSKDEPVLLYLKKPCYSGLI